MGGGGLFSGFDLLSPFLNYFCFTDKCFNLQQLAKFDADILMFINKIAIYYF